MFDECFTREGSRVLGEMLSLFDPPIESAFLVDYLGVEGAWDENWGPSLAGKGWIVVSRDLGRTRKIKAKGAPLHIVLPRSKVTGIFLSGQLGTASRFEMVRAVTCVLPDVFACPREPAGTRFRIQKNAGNYHLSRWDVKKKENSQFS